MTLSVEFARFTVRPGAEARFDGPTTAEMIRTLRAHFDGLLFGVRARLDDQDWVDVFVWESREKAEHAAAQLANVPELAAYFADLEQVVEMKHGTLVHEEPRVG